jgi:uncharacterized protein
MFTEKELKSKKVPDLKKIAKENDIQLPKSVKKDELIKLILKIFAKKDENKSVKPEEPVKEERKTKKIDFSKLPDLPGSYGKDKLVFMIKDPNWGFIYWEFSENLTRAHNIYDGATEKILRVYDISENKSPETAHYFIDVKINLFTNNWYLDFLAPNKTYIIELGYMKDGSFIPVLRSNSASTPRDSVSDQIDEEWMLTDDQFRTILMASGFDGMKRGSSGEWITSSGFRNTPGKI